MMRAASVLLGLLLAGSLYAGVRSAMTQNGERPKDKFAEIGAWQQSDYHDRRLVPIEPPKLSEHVLPLDAAGIASAFQPGAKMTTAEQLREELKRQRDLHAPYLQDLSPALEDSRIRIGLKAFDWRVETEADRADFAGVTLAGKGEWQRVNIPHYGLPMGRAATYYRTEFDVTPAMMEKGAVFVHFKGVDYKAQVFVNGALLGCHEGFFAPFEFECTPHVRVGKNVLTIRVLNDYVTSGNSGSDPKTGRLGAYLFGNKIAVVGPGWDDPQVGWHVCPPGMGIYQDVSIEARPRIFVHDIFVRPLLEEGKAEAWIELFGCDAKPQQVAIQLSLFGQNFPAAVFIGKTYAPKGTQIPGTEQNRQPMDLSVCPGVNRYKIPLVIPQVRLWEPETPWLYQLQVKMFNSKGKLLDTGKRQFGMRLVRMERVKEPKGRMYLNGRPIKLRGADIHGALVQRVLRKDWNGLIDDILLAKITRMNFIRLTQYIPPSEIYDYCDRLGLMLQTDMPLHYAIPRSQFCEAVRQAEEMERLIRSHPSAILVTYFNEPFNAANPFTLGEGQGQRNLVRPELTHLFEAADMVVHMANPDRVSKAVDGDFDPPGPGLPDNHCYTAWYNGQGVEMGALHKGYWQPVKPGWVYGCGEFGAEGLDPVELMRKYYPKPWLPQTADEERHWSPDKIPFAQTGTMHPNFFETPNTLAEWVARSQAHQAWATRLVAEAFRRDCRMHSFAIHLFIDTFPDGWMKAIVDCDRQPKPAWFVYRDVLTPLAVNLRTDRRAFFAGETMGLEAWVCNDRSDAPAGATLHYQLELDGKVLQAGSTAADVPAFDSAYRGTVRFEAPEVQRRAAVTVRLGLLDAGGKLLHDTSLVLDVFPRPNDLKLRRLFVIGPPDGKAAQLAKELGSQPVVAGPMEADDAILVDDLKAFAKVEKEVAEAVRKGARAVFLELPAGKHRIGQDEVVVAAEKTGAHFVSRATGHRLVEGFLPEDFKFWYNAKLNRPSPLLNAPTFEATGWEPILLSFKHMAAGWKPDGKGHWCVCQVALSGRTAGNPVAEIFARRLLAK
ncbi:MAG: glycoside hydrolase family 2 [Planctomycetia bacterium]|nr:glycoside hydrolase family 2 [Planctomycetia bacterium]